MTKWMWILALSIMTCEAFELMVVQSVSSTEKSFVTRSGLMNGVTIGQKATFTTKDFSLVAEATASTREYTVWQVNAEDATVPFKKGDIVTYNNSLESIWTSLDAIEKKKKKTRSFEKEIRALIFKGNAYSAFKETIANSSIEGTTRVGNGFEVLYQSRLRKYFYLGYGLRIDSEISESSIFTAPTKRYLAIIDLAFHLPKFPQSNINLYAAIGGGIGRQSTEFATEQTSGTAYVLPYLRVGTEYKFAQDTWGLMLEGSVEAISATETFESGTDQSVSILNGKVSVGLKKYF